MAYEENYNRDTFSEESDPQAVSFASLTSGAGVVTLEGASKTHQPAVVLRSQNPTTLFITADPVSTRMPNNQPQPNPRQYLKSAETLVTNRNTHTVDVSVKAGSEARNHLIKQLFLVAFGMILCGIPLAVVSTLYALDKTTTSTITPSTSATAAVSVTTLVFPNQCASYTINNDSTRNIAYGPGSLCDNTLTTGWYRFLGGAGTRLATSHVSRDTCCTYYGGSYNGSLPSTAGTTTFGTLCLNNNGYLCFALWSGSLIGVTNCGSYYVYYLSPIANCNSRYCTTN